MIPQRHILGMVFASLTLAMGCDQSPSPGTARTNFIDAARTEHHQLGLLGVSGHPLGGDIAIMHEEEEIHPGGVVITEVHTDTPLSGRLRVGDVIVRIGDDFVPNKEDPTIDVIEMIESTIVDTSTEVPLGVYREGALTTLDWTPKVPSLNQGLPELPVRFATAIERGLAFLRTQQREDGSFSPRDDASLSERIILTSFVGSAFVAGLEQDEDGTVKGCLDFLKNTVEADAPLTPFAQASALHLFAQMMGGMPPDMSLIGPMGRTLAALRASQGEDGGWSAMGGESDESLGPNELTLTTNLALLALGSLERNGIQGDDELGTCIEKACAFLKAKTNDGRVFTRFDDDFDRRAEAGRSAGAALALHALGCPASDPFFTELGEYHQKYLSEVPSAPNAVLYHLMHSACLHRVLGRSSWESFYFEFRYLLMSLQCPDGSFAAIPHSSPERWPIDEALDSPAWRTALVVLTLAAKEGRLALFHSPPQLRTRNSDGVLQESGSEAPGEGMPDMDGKKVMQFNSLEEAQEFLKSMGVDPSQLESGAGTIEMKSEKKEGDG